MHVICAMCEYEYEYLQPRGTRAKQLNLGIIGGENVSAEEPRKDEGAGNRPISCPGPTWQQAGAEGPPSQPRPCEDEPRPHEDVRWSRDAWRPRSWPRDDDAPTGTDQHHERRTRTILN